jgi:polyisoprenoid-binding protein YceI
VKSDPGVLHPLSPIWRAMTQSHVFFDLKILRAGFIGLTLTAFTACTPLRVVTHSVSPSEASVPPGQYQLDPHHWNVNFDVDHFHYTRFTMRFDKATAVLDWNVGGIEQSSVSATIDAASLDTNNPLLDKMVKGDQMLDVERHPTIRFVSTSFMPTGDNTGTLTGNLTIRDATHPVTLTVKFNGHAPNPLTKEETLGFSADGHFNRADFGLATWYPAVGDDVHVSIQAEFVKPAPGTAPS